MSTALPPKIPSDSRNSIFHQAATASVFAPLIAIGINIATTASRTNLDPQTQRPVALIVGIVCSLIILIGLVCGVAALFGIRNHGKKGILGKALCGIMIPLLLAAIAIPNFRAARARAMRNNQTQLSVDDRVRDLAHELNKQATKMVDEVTRLEGVEPLPNRTLLYKYSLITKTASGIPLDALNQHVRPGVVKRYKTLPEMKIFRDNGITITYQYRDKEGQLIGDFSVGPSDLAQ